MMRWRYALPPCIESDSLNRFRLLFSYFSDADETDRFITLLQLTDVPVQTLLASNTAVFRDRGPCLEMYSWRFFCILTRTLRPGTKCLSSSEVTVSVCLHQLEISTCQECIHQPDHRISLSNAHYGTVYGLPNMTRTCVNSFQRKL